jgi:hypothetical protein
MAAVGLSGTASSVADAILGLGDTVTATGTGAGQTYTVTGTNGDNGTISPTVTYDFGNFFNQTVGGVTYQNTGADFNLYPAYAQGANGSGGPWNFQDSYFFETTGATIQTAVISGGLSNVNDLQVRLIQISTGTAPSSATPWLGPVSGVTVVDSWQTVNIPGFGSFNETLPTGFAASAPGTQYVLQVRGEAVGDTAASYAGTIGFAAVPLPASIWLLLGALGGVSLLSRGRRCGDVARHRGS